MASPEDIAQQRDLLRKYRAHLAVLIAQQAEQGLYAPPHVATSIASDRESIQRIKDILRGWNETVDDHPDDVAPPPAQTAKQAGQRAAQIGRDQINIHDSPGAIAGRTGDVAQNYGTQNTTNAATVINIHGGDFRGSNLPIGNTVGRDLNQTAGATTIGNVYTIAGDLNISPKPSKDEFLMALRQLKNELAKAKDLPLDEASDLKDNLDDAIEATERPQPNKQRAIKKLTAMKDILDGLKDNVGSALALGHLIGQVVQAAQGLAL
jgi:hypothetical protein